MKSHFGHALAHLMELEQLTQAGLADASGVDRPTISQYINGHASPTRERLAALVAAISDERDRRLELLLAHARDEVEAGSAGAGIAPENYIIARSADDTGLVVPLHLQATFQTLVNEASRPDRSEARDVLDALAQMILAGKAEAADRQTRYPEPRLVDLPQVAESGENPPASSELTQTLSTGFSANASTKLSGSPLSTARGKSAGKRKRE